MHYADTSTFVNFPLIWLYNGPLQSKMYMYVQQINGILKYDQGSKWRRAQ